MAKTTTTNPKARRLSRSWILLIVTIVLLLLVLLLLVIIIALTSTKGFGRWVNNVCTTEPCAHDASRVMLYMNQQSDPCDDFYEYACGNYANNFVIPPGSGSFSAFNHQAGRLLILLKGLLETPITADDTEVVKRSKNYYMSCMNETEIDNLGIKPLKDLVKNDWAVLVNSSFDSASFNLEDYWLKLALDQPWPGYLNNFFYISTIEDFNNSTRYIVTVGEAELGIGGGTRDYYLKGRNDKIILAYEQMVVDIAVNLGADKQIAQSEIAKMVDFEIKLANISLPNDQKTVSAGLFRSINVTTMMKDYPGVDWRKLIFRSFQKVSITLKDEAEFIVSETPYLEKLGELLKATDARTLATYMMWRVLKVKISYLDTKTREIGLNFQKAFQGFATASPRYVVCSSDTNNKFKFVTAKMFVDKYFTKGSADVQDMTRKIKEAFRERLTQVTWLDETSRESAYEKLDNMKSMMAYPDGINNDTWLSENVMKFGPISPLEYFTIGSTIDNTFVLERLNRLNKAVDQDIWTLAPVIVNAYYLPTANRIVFPVGILQPPFYNIEGLKFLNYGNLGFIIGHEVTHGFDNSGRLFDAYGNKNEWMPLTSVAGFQEGANCFIDQYGNITVKDIGEKVNGKLTQGENIADNGGLSTAFEAYNNWVKDNGDEQSLPGLSLTPHQLFFVSFAQFGCSLNTPEALIAKVRTHQHTPQRERVLGALLNSKEFSQSYNCPVGSKMNPKHKCMLW